MSNDATLDFNAVVAARARIADAVVKTELREATVKGRRIWLKCESTQTGGAFKLRGATNRLRLLSDEERQRGVVAFSSGNHAQGVAIAARRLGIDAIIVMPADAPLLKVEGTRRESAEVVFYDRRSESREAIAARIAAERGATVVPSFDDEHVITGQGTVGLEIVEQLGTAPDQIVTPCGGGGLAAGLALACPEAALTIVEPEGWDDMRRSLEQGEIVPVEADAPPTLCDALQTPRVSPLTFNVLRRRQATALAVSEDAVRDAVRWAWEEQALVIEPGGAVALAAVMTGAATVVGETVVILSGGNIDPALHARIVAGG